MVYPVSNSLVLAAGGPMSGYIKLHPNRLRRRLQKSRLMDTPLTRDEARVLALHIIGLDPCVSHMFLDFYKTIARGHEKRLPSPLKTHLLSKGFRERSTVNFNRDVLTAFVDFLNFLDEPELRSAGLVYPSIEDPSLTPESILEDKTMALVASLGPRFVVVHRSRSSTPIGRNLADEIFRLRKGLIPKRPAG